jgi:hypothetical protein
LNTGRDAEVAARTVIEGHVEQKRLVSSSGIFNELCTRVRITLSERVESGRLLDNSQILQKRNQTYQVRTVSENQTSCYLD